MRWLCVDGRKLMKLKDALNERISAGFETIRAAQLAELMYPDARRQNANGQTFNLCCGVAGRLLRLSHFVRETQNGEFEIIKARLKYDA